MSYPGSPSQSRSSTPIDLGETLAGFSEHLAELLMRFDVLEQRLDRLESKPTSSTANAPSSSPAAAAKPKPAKSTKGKGKAKAPTTTTPSTGVPVSTQVRVSTLDKAIAKAVQEKTTLSMFIPDEMAGHVVGRAGSGLKQIHDISSAKVSVSPTVTAGFRTVTIKGTDREVGDALSAIGKRMARRRLRTPTKKAKKDKAPSSGNLFTADPNPPPVKTRMLPTHTRVTTPTQSKGTTPISRTPSQQPSPMVVVTPSPISTPFPSHGGTTERQSRTYTPMNVEPSATSSLHSPMDIGALQEDRSEDSEVGRPPIGTPQYRDWLRNKVARGKRGRGRG
jgi:hypothetical protein